MRRAHLHDSRTEGAKAVQGLCATALGEVCFPAQINLVAQNGKSNRKIDFLEDISTKMQRQTNTFTARFLRMARCCYCRGLGMDHRVRDEIVHSECSWPRLSGIKTPEKPRKAIRAVVRASLDEQRSKTSPGNYKEELEARAGIEPAHKGFADLSLTTWVPRLWQGCLDSSLHIAVANPAGAGGRFGAGDEI
jgi:hypothetical protein